MEFRLIYSGSLEASTSSKNRVSEKHAIRKELHKQLKVLWSQMQPFSRWLTQPMNASNTWDGKEHTVIEAIAHQYGKYGFNWVPTITSDRGLSVALDILFLRRDQPGNLIKHGGDIDNRLKTLFDALRMPSDRSQVDKFSPDTREEDPFFVLLEDDALISKVAVTTDRLITPPRDSDSINDVHLVISVTVKVYAVSRQLSNIEFLSS